MAIVGALIKGALGGYGKKPEELMPAYKDLTDIQGQAVSGDLATLPGSEKLAAQVNQFSQDQLTAALGRQIPGYNNLITQMAGNIGSELRGELPKDVADLIKRTTAEGAITGSGGSSQAVNFGLAKNLGLTSLGLMQQAQDSFSRWTAQASQMLQPGMLNVSSMFLTPAQRVGVEDSRTAANFQAMLRNASIKAAPDPFMKALGDAFINDENSIMQLAGSGIGAAAGGTGGGGGGGGL